jgi:hypothetical protein
MTDDFQTQQGHLGSSELDKRLCDIRLEKLSLQKELCHWLGNIKLCLKRAGQAFRISGGLLPLIAKNYSIQLGLIFLLWLQKVRISLLNPFIKTTQSKDEDLVGNPVNKG